jgi:DNA-binding protein YbaB
MTEIRNLEGLAEYAHEQIERIERMQRDLAQYAGEGTSPGGHVYARTGPGGALLDLRVEPSALRLSADEVADEVRAAIGTAQQEYARRADDIMAPVLGLRPSEQAVDALEQGMSRLDALTADLERLTHDRRLAAD